MTPWVIVGCGYTGDRLAARLAALGARVLATTRRPEHAVELAAVAGVQGRVLDPSAPGALDGWIPAGAVVVNSVPPRGAGPLLEPALVAAAARAGARRTVYLSSTGVYPRGDGGWVDEDSPVAPGGERGARRLEAERACLDAARAAGHEAVALRVAAIYGPGRGVQERLRRGEHVVVGTGAHFVSRVHVEDLVSAIVAAGTVSPLPRPVYVVGDDEPTTTRAHADAVAALLGLPPPPSIPVEDAPGGASEMHLGNRRVRNARLKDELGVTLRYPTWREGLAAILSSDAPPR